MLPIVSFKLYLKLNAVFLCGEGGEREISDTEGVHCYDEKPHTL